MKNVTFGFAISQHNTTDHVPMFLTAAPTFAEGQFRAKINDKNDSEHTLMAGGNSDFAPRYPVFMATAPPLD